ncbi:transglutaminaseTgpA domain-containing protein [Bifidobacterium saguinibicoloris]|uniref:transglutaminaseTgpA domain-containing protein n=1 Tax=Bifidobacterium saguinibicoloris TaxID=2834433 RepID=UPI001C561720|nr:transglutaminaseTgpA domain-containing protein [Bifidobacterium saguinibicoloris]MBW3081012.1 DUF58 domain-containing protein [Bifidobacterium saguinibicoloris]
MLLTAVGALACYAGLLLDERTLVAATVCIVALVVVSLLLTVAQWVLMRAGTATPDTAAATDRPGASDVRTGRRLHTRLRAWLTPGERHTTPQYEMVDQRGAVVGRVAGEVPRRRGLYRHHSRVIRWTGPFGLFAAARVTPWAGRTLMLPDVPSGEGDGVHAPDRRMAGAGQEEQSGGVRAYAPGDPIRLVSWRHTARRGRLMTRETAGDARPTVLLVLGTGTSHGVGSGDVGDGRIARRYGRPRAGAEEATTLDRAVAALMACLPRRGRGTAAVRIVATDGERFHEGLGEVKRFLASARTVPYAGDDSAQARAKAVAAYAARRSGPLRIVVCDADDDRSLRQALQRGPAAGMTRAVEPAATVTVAADDASDIGPAHGDAAASRMPEGTPSDRTAASDGTTARAPKTMSGLLPRVVAALALLVCFALTLRGLTGLVNPTGVWAWYAAALLAVAAVGATIPYGSGDAWAGTREEAREEARADGVVRRRILHRAARVAAYALAALAGAAVLTAVRAHDALTDADHPWRALAGVLAAGFDRLNLQLPPIKVDADGDVFLVVVVAAAAVALRCLLLWRGAMPLMAVLPVAALAADYSVVGHATPWWAVAALALAFPLSLWAYRPRRLGPPATATAALLVMAVTLAGTPTGEAIAYRVPLSIGEGGGMFTSNTVSPLIDLKRNITAGSDSIMLHYRSYKRLYLRMATLDEFDGDTWGYGRDLAIDAGLYGAGIQLGRSSENDLTDEQRESIEPLTAYMYSLGYYGYDGAGVSQDGIERYMGYANIRIDTLRSRFLPMPGIAYGQQGLGSDWLQYRDGSVYNRSGSSMSGTSYTANGTYIDPIRSASGFADLTDIVDTERGFERQWSSVAERIGGWLRERRALQAAGLGEVRGDAVLIRTTIGDDGVVYGPNGWRLGKVDSYQMSFGSSMPQGDGTGDGAGDGSGGDGSDGGSGGGSVDGGVGGRWQNARMTTGTPASITFDDAVREQLGFGEDGMVIGSSPTGEVGIVVPLVDTTEQVGAWYDVSSGTVRMNRPDGSDMAEWESDAHRALYAAGMSRDIVTWESAAEAGSVILKEVRKVVESSDRRAHASRYTSLTDTLPANVRAVVRRAQADGVPITGKSYDDQMRAMRWLVDYFTAKDQHFTYSLDAPDGDGRSNLEVIDAFLDPKTGHAGYCQHYASALAVLGRAMGVPTRVVLGYNAGTEEGNARDTAGYTPVRSRQLHAWVEAYLDGVGWVPFDVTPASAQNGTLSSAASGADASSRSAGSDAAGAQTTDGGAGTADGESGAERDAASADGDARKNGKTAGGAKTSRGDAADGDVTVWARVAAWFAALPTWARIVLPACGVAALLALLVFAPRGVRRWRRRRGLLAIRRAAAAPPDDMDARARAWRAAWTLLRREGRRSGVRWRASDTDRAIGEAIARAWEDAGGSDASDGAGSGPSADAAATVRTVARNVAAAAFGGTPDRPEGLEERVRRAPDGVPRPARTPSRWPRPLRHADARKRLDF